VAWLSALREVRGSGELGPQTAEDAFNTTKNTMERFARIPIFLALACLAVAWPNPQCLAHGGDQTNNGVEKKEGEHPVEKPEPAGVAEKIRHLAALALLPNANNGVKNAIENETNRVAKDKKLLEAVALQLLQDEGFDPKVRQINYRDGTIRGLVFIKRDADHSQKPPVIVWTFDAKRAKRDDAGSN
jgi:hypothetical protein